MPFRRLSRAAAAVSLVIGAAACPGAVPVWAGIADLRVNEIMAANGTTLLDEGGDSHDWVEIYNSGTTAVNLEGMFLTDTPLDSRQWSFPDTLLPAHGYLIVWCDNEPLEGPLHATFALDSDGEFVGLYEYLGIGNDVIDSTSFGSQARDVSFGRYPNGSGPYGYMPYPTPRLTNSPHGNVPPFFEDTDVFPTVPGAGEAPTVFTKISDDSQVLQARAYYATDGSFEYTWLYDDGAHNDDQPADGKYGGTFPGFPAYTSVRYYIWAMDDSSASGTDPIDAPAETFSYVVAYEPPRLYINEFMALNNTTITDEWGEYDDWVEIYNRTDTDVQLGGMHLTDDPNDTNRFTFPDRILPAREFLIVWIDNDPEQGALHAGFGLSASGEFIGLYDRDAVNRAVIDSLSFGMQAADVSLGRFPNSSDVWLAFHPASPGESNNGAAVEDPGDRPRLRILALTNPAVQSAGLRFEAPVAGRVRLSVHDVTGREVARGAMIVASGVHEHDLDLRDLSNGAYYLRLDFLGGSAGRRFVVIR